MTTSLYGVNLAGAEFQAEFTKLKTTATPNQYAPDAAPTSAPYGTRAVNYFWPKNEAFRHWLERNTANCIRIPFRWERLQYDVMGPLDAANLVELKRCVSACTSRGATALIDCHNYARRWYPATFAHPTTGVPVKGFLESQIDGNWGLTSDHFADFWGKLAGEFKNDSLVAFDLMNEPHDMVAADGVGESVQCRRFYQAAINAIRAAGAQNSIHVQGPGWGKPNRIATDWGVEAMNLADPLSKLVFHCHQYIDAGENGDGFDLAGNDLDYGIKKVQAATAWARANGKKLFLGEFGMASVVHANAELNRQAHDRWLSYLETNSDVWAGWTAWGAGAWAATYIYKIEPNSYALHDALLVLENHLPPKPITGIDPAVHAAAVARADAAEALLTQIAAFEEKVDAIWAECDDLMVAIEPYGYTPPADA
jgi:endoglucanase